MEWRHIQAAQRLLASERGAIVRDWGGRVPIALAYPNSYAIGMSSLAMHSLYHWFNDMPGIVCERAFDSFGRYASSQDPVLTLESQRPIAEAAAIVGMSEGAARVALHRARRSLRELLVEEKQS